MVGWFCQLVAVSFCTNFATFISPTIVGFKHKRLAIMGVANGGTSGDPLACLDNLVSSCNALFFSFVEEF